jgi:hypothetical protein
VLPSVSVRVIGVELPAAKAVVEDRHHRAGLQAQRQVLHEERELALLHVRPPEAGERGIAAVGKPSSATASALKNAALPGGDRLLAGDVEHRTR